MKKHFLKSKTIAGAGINLLASVTMFFLTSNMQTKYFAIVTGITAIVAIIGRFMARTNLHI